MDIAGVILAGGKNTRYNGFDKSFLKYGNTSFIEHTICTLKEIFSEIIIITNQTQAYKKFKDAIISEDLIKDIGPLGGIYTALKITSKPAIFVVSCDMPFLHQSMIRLLIHEFKFTNPDVLMPAVDLKIEPLHAVYSKNIIPYIETNVKEMKFAIRDLFPMINIQFQELNSTDANKKYFTNINRPADFDVLIKE
jgi:molybdenum cofactor guanylyltransferase